jgi:hypothetical protein
VGDSRVETVGLQSILTMSRFRNANRVLREADDEETSEGVLNENGGCLRL